MTREEAKEILTHNWTRVDNPNYSESELDEAFSMAIEALETQYNCIICPRCGKVFSELDGRKGGDAEINETKSPYMQPSPKGEDLINREDAIEAVEKEKAIDPFGRYDKQNIGIDWALDALKALPSAEAVQRWIPVEEQPPAFPCLVCDANGNQPSVPLGIVTITDEEHGEWHIDGRLWDTKIFFKGEWCSQTGYGNRIIAWMPLPTPYKGGEDE